MTRVFGDDGSGVWERLGIKPFLHQIISQEAIREGNHVVVSAPTGAGKTEAAVVPILAEMVEMGGEAEPIVVLYITPLRALINDLTRRLRGIFEPFGFRVARKHGDVSLKERRERLQNIPHILITTPESLEIDLDMSVKFRKYLKNVRWVIIDELHEIASTKRGLQLAFLLERLRRQAGDFQVLALSATMDNPLKALQPFLGSSKRDVRVVFGGRKKYSIRVVRADDLKEGLRSVLRDGKKTIVFVNSRRLAEKIHEFLDDEIDAEVHHSSVSGEIKEQVESRLKSGEVSVVIATKTLELGIDVGAVDQVIHLGAPISVTSLLQRAGRAGHSVDRVSEAVIISDNDEDYYLSLAAKNLAERGVLEELSGMPCFLDVVAREILGMSLKTSGVSVDEAVDILTSVDACRGRASEIREVINLLSSQGLLRIGDEGLKIGPYFYRFWSRKGPGGDVRRFFTLIPNTDDKFTVKVGDKNVGTLDVAYVLKYLRPWDSVRIGGRIWNIVNIDLVHKTIIVKPAEGGGEIPSWGGSMITHSSLLSRELFECLRRCSECDICSDGLHEWFKGSRIEISPNVLYLERGDGSTFIWGAQGHKFFEVLGYLLAYSALVIGHGIVGVRVSPLGIEVRDFEKLWSALRSLGDGSEVIEEAIKLSPQYHMKLRELLVSFGTMKNSIVIREAVRQVLIGLGQETGTLETLHRFLKGDIPIIAVRSPVLSPIARIISSAPPLRPWYGATLHVIAEALRGMALTAEEVSEVTNLPPDYVERKLKQMRKLKGSLKTVAFYDTFDGQVRWVLAEELEELADDLLKDSFTPDSCLDLMVSVMVDKIDPGKSIVVRLFTDDLNGLFQSMETDEFYKVKVKPLYGSYKGLTYYYIPKKILPLIIKNAATQMGAMGLCE